MSKKPFVGQMVQFQQPGDRGLMTAPLAAIIACVIADDIVHLAGWDRAGQPWQKKHVHFGGPKIGGEYCIPA